MGRRQRQDSSASTPRACWSAATAPAAISPLSWRYAARDGDGPKLAGQVLIYPATDFAMKHPSHQRAGDQHPADALRDQMVLQPLSQRRRRHRSTGSASPARAETLAGLPPAYVLTAGADPLRDEGDEYAARLKEAGVP